MAATSKITSSFITVLNENDGVPGSKFESEPDNYTLEQLKRWLKCRGLKLSRKRSDLIARVNNCLSSGNNHVLDPSIDDGKWFEAKALREKTGDDVKKPNLRKIPDIPNSGWKKFPAYDIPSQFNYGHVHYYGLESLPSSNEEENDDNESHGLGHMTDKPFKNGRKYVESGFVHDITDNKNDDYYFLRAHVWPSMRNDYPHNVTIVLSSISGAVVHAMCNPCKVSQLGRCSHIIAVLLHLTDHVKANGFTVSTPCTSKECSWNKGKKRKKNPQRLSEANYPSKKKKSRIKVIEFDPRPPQYRFVTEKHLNALFRNIEKDCSRTGKSSMWTTQLKLKYADYKLEDIDLSVLEEQLKVLECNITPPSLMQIQGTEAQSKSEMWQSERWLRLTASKCIEAFRVGKLVLDDSSTALIRCKKFICSYIWNLVSPNYQSVWMARGLESELEAVSKYQEQTKQQVDPSGLWVNPKFPWLACSPDGLVGPNGLIEIKSLKIFSDHTIKAVSEDYSVVPKEVLGRQCFNIKDKQCYLKHTHNYFYQVQMQLLVTEREFCDFVLYAKDGPVSIERITRDDQLISDILVNLTALWKKVIAPEIFEMRVPRDLNPFILPVLNPVNINPSSGSTNTHPSQPTVSPGSTNTHPSQPTLSPGSTNTHPSQPTVSPGSTDTHPSQPTVSPGSTNTHPSQPTVSHGSTDTHPSQPTVSHGSTDTHPFLSQSSCHIDNSYSQDEIDIASFLAQSKIPDDLIAIPWGGMTNRGLSLTNTCPLDNWLMILQSLVKSKKINLDILKRGDAIKRALHLVELHQFGDAKLTLPTPPLVTPGDLYGNEADYYMPLFSSVLTSEVTTSCNLASCPSPCNTHKTCSNTLGCPSGQDYSFEKSLSEWLNPGPTLCQRKFYSQPSIGIPCTQNISIDCNGTQYLSWHCSGMRTSTARHFCSFGDIFIFSLDLASRAGYLRMDNLPMVIKLNTKELYLHSVTLWNGHHYICVFNHFHAWLVYDGLKEYRKPNSGLSIYKAQPLGYSISHVIYIV